MVINDGVDARVQLMDPKTLTAVWDVAFPAQMEFDSVLAGGLASDGKTYQEPSFLFRQTDRVKTVYCSSRSDATFKGQGPRLQRSVEPVLSQGEIADPRMIVPLPWNQRFFVHSEVFSMLSQEVPIAIGVFIFPAFFLWAMFRKKRWSLQTFMLLPLLFVVPWVCLNLPVSDAIFFMDQGTSELMAKAMLGLFIVPILLVVGELVYRVWKFQWVRLFLMLVVVALLSVAYAALLFTFDISNLPPGGRYDLWDPLSLLLLNIGAWFFGIWIVFRTVIQALGYGLANLRKPKPELA